MIAVLISLAVAYLLGSISPSYLLGKLLKGIDLREHGSGNVGTTNAFRVLGRGAGITTLVFDVVKGLFAVQMLGAFCEAHFSIPLDPMVYRIFLGLSVIVGHNWTIFLKFKGGKGVATSLGVFLALSPKAILIATAIWSLLALATRRVSLGSLAAALSAPFVMFFLRESPILIIFSVFITVVIFYTHRSNIRKIFFGKK